MSDENSKSESIIGRVARWYVRRKVDGEAQTRARIDAAADGEDDPGEIAELLQRKAGRKAALRGFLTGLGSSPYTAIPLALLNLGGATSQQLEFAADVGLLRDGEFFAREGWEDEILRAVIGVEAGVLGASIFARAAVESFVVGRIKKAGVRVAANFVPIVGGLVGAVVEHVLVLRATSSIRERLQTTSEPDLRAVA